MSDGRGVINRERCRKRKAVSTTRCMGDHGHEGLHWAWSGDHMKTWSEAGCARKEADRPDWYYFLERP